MRRYGRGGYLREYSSLKINGTPKEYAYTNGAGLSINTSIPLNVADPYTGIYDILEPNTQFSPQIVEIKKASGIFERVRIVTIIHRNEFEGYRNIILVNSTGMSPLGVDTIKVVYSQIAEENKYYYEDYVVNNSIIQENKVYLGSVDPILFDSSLNLIALVSNSKGLFGTHLHKSSTTGCIYLSILGNEEDLSEIPS